MFFGLSRFHAPACRLGKVFRATVSRGPRNSGGIAAGSGRRGFVRVLHLQGCAGSDSSASDDDLGHRSGFCLFGSFGCFLFAAARRAWKACGQSLWTLFSSLAFGAWIAPSLPPFRLSALYLRLALWVVGGAEGMESGGQSLFALRSGFGFGSRIDHASHTPRCRRPVPVRRFPFRNGPAGLFHNNFFGLGRGNVDNPFRRFRPCLDPGLDCPHSHSPIRPRRSGRDPSSGLRRP